MIVSDCEVGVGFDGWVASFVVGVEGRMGCDGVGQLWWGGAKGCVVLVFMT